MSSTDNNNQHNNSMSRGSDINKRESNSNSDENSVNKDRKEQPSKK